MIRRKKYLNKRIVILPTAVVFTLAVMFTGCGEANTENSKAVYKITEEGINFKMQILVVILHRDQTLLTRIRFHTGNI